MLTQKSKFFFLTIALVFPVLLALWIMVLTPWAERLPGNFSYQADIASYDNFYDETTQAFSGESQSVSDFSYQAVGQQNGAVLIDNSFGVRTTSGQAIFSATRHFAIDPETLRHLPILEDQSRQGYLFAPKNLNKGDPFTYWHVNYDAPANMQFAGEEDLFGLRVYRYETYYTGQRVDQTKNLSYLPEVGITKGIEVEPYLQLWVEPVTGRLIKYEDRSTAYYYDLATGTRLAPWNKFHNRFTLASVQQQVSLAETEKFRNFMLEQFLPGLGIILYLLFLAVGCLLSFCPAIYRERVIRFLPFVILLACLAGTYYTWGVALEIIKKQTAIRFETDTNTIQEAIDNRLALYVNALRGTQGFFNGSQQVSREEWRNYVSSLELDQYYPGLQAMAFAPLVTKSQLADHIQKIRQEGFSDYTVTPAGERDVYTPVLYFEPVDGRNKPALGYDMFSESVRSQAMIRARDTGEISLSGKVRLVTETDTDPQSGSLIYAPVYRPGLDISSMEARQKALSGYVLSVFRMNDLLRGIVASRDYNINFKIYDSVSAQEISEANLMYDYHAGETAGTESFLSEFAATKTLQLFGHTWTIQYLALPEYTWNTNQHLIPITVLWSCLLVSFVMFFAIFALGSSRSRATRLAEKMTTDLRQSKQALERQLEETERLNRLMIGRELKMIELKKKLRQPEP